MHDRNGIISKDDQNIRILGFDAVSSQQPRRANVEPRVGLLRFTDPTLVDLLYYSCMPAGVEVAVH